MSPREIKLLKESMDLELDAFRKSIADGKGWSKEGGTCVVRIPDPLHGLNVEWVREVRRRREGRDDYRSDSGPWRGYEELGGKISEEVCWALAPITCLCRKFADSLRRPDLAIRDRQDFDSDLLMLYESEYFKNK
jgi:hypothetical protein